MKNKLFLATMLVIVAMVLVVPMISAAGLTATWNGGTGYATNYTNATGTFLFNCTVTAKAVTNVTIYANSSSGVMNPLQSFVNTSANQAAWTGTVTITSADDGSNQNLTCYVRNATANAYSSEKGCWHVTLDSTDPTCSILAAHNTIAWKGNQVITTASADALLRKSTVTTIDGPGTQTSITDTSASRSIELGSNETNYIGTWTASILVTDSAGNTCTDSVTFKSYMPGDTPAEKQAELDAQLTASEKEKSKTWMLLIVIGVALWLIFKKKK
jgi:hypothetical protein